MAKRELGLTETKRHPNADLADLRLSDTMIDMLKKKRGDTTLLGELVAHPDFMKLLADISIYVNGIAAMQIHNLNTWVEVARAKIIADYQPEEQDMDALLTDAVFFGNGTTLLAVFTGTLTPSWRTFERPIEAGVKAALSILPLLN